VLSYEHDIYIYIYIYLNIYIKICAAICSGDLTSLACFDVRTLDLSLKVKVLLPVFPQSKSNFVHTFGESVNKIHRRFHQILMCPFVNFLSIL